MTVLLTALGSGISAKKILEFLMRKSPELAPRITQALASGLSAEKIIKYFSKGQNFEKLRASMEEAYSMDTNANPLVQAQNVRNQNLGTDITSGFQRTVPGLIGTAGAIGTSYALSRAIPAILQKGQPTPSLQTTQVGTQTQTPLIPQTSQPPIVSPTIAQPAQAIQPEGIPTNVTEILSKHGSKNKVDELIQAKNGPEQIAGYFKKFSPKIASDIEKESGQPFEKVVEQYISQVPKEQIKAEEVIEPKESIHISILKEMASKSQKG